MPISPPLLGENQDRTEFSRGRIMGPSGADRRTRRQYNPIHPLISNNPHICSSLTLLFVTVMSMATLVLFTKKKKKKTIVFRARSKIRLVLLLICLVVSLQPPLQCYEAHSRYLPVCTESPWSSWTARACGARPRRAWLWKSVSVTTVAPVDLCPRLKPLIRLLKRGLLGWGLPPSACYSSVFCCCCVSMPHHHSACTGCQHMQRPSHCMHNASPQLFYRQSWGKMAFSGRFGNGIFRKTQKWHFQEKSEMFKANTSPANNLYL